MRTRGWGGHAPSRSASARPYLLSFPPADHAFPGPKPRGISDVSAQSSQTSQERPAQEGVMSTEMPTGMQRGIVACGSRALRIATPPRPQRARGMSRE